MSEAAPAPAPAAAPAGGNNKMMFIMMGAMFFLLLAGMGGLFFVMKSKSTPAAEAAGEHGAAKEEKHEEKAAALYIGLEPPFVVNFPADSPVKFMQVQVQIMTREANMEHLIRGNDPAIRNDLLNLFGSQTYEAVSTVAGKEDLRSKALEAVRNVVKSEGGDPKLVGAVYFTSFVMQ